MDENILSDDNSFSSQLYFDNLKPQKENVRSFELPSWEKEWKQIKERDWEADFGLISISGKPGSGTSSAAKIIASLYGAELYKAGDTIRELAGATDRTKSIKRDPEVDAKVDGHIRMMTVSAKKGFPQIAEAQIGGATVLETAQSLQKTGKYPEAPIIRILFWANKDERIRRLKLTSDMEADQKKDKINMILSSGTTEEVLEATKSELHDRVDDLDFISDDNLRQLTERVIVERLKVLARGNNEEIKNLLSKLLGEIHYKSRQQIIEETTKREKDDLTYWKALYPTLIGNDNPLDKDAKDARGNNIYSTPAFDNSNWVTPERSAYEVHKYLVDGGYVRPKVRMWPNRPVSLSNSQEERLTNPREDDIN